MKNGRPVKTCRKQVFTRVYENWVKERVYVLSIFVDCYKLWVNPGTLFVMDIIRFTFFSFLCHKTNYEIAIGCCVSYILIVFDSVMKEAFVTLAEMGITDQTSFLSFNLNIVYFLFHFVLILKAAFIV